MASLLSTECDKRLSTSLSTDFWRTLKQEDIYIRGYETVTECRQGLKVFMTRYNDERLHSSLDWNTPADVYFKRVRLGNVA
ncbi:MAG: integrase core domain-containing protein [Candidatus Saccharibacteria bacterium]|nr:integrase core domain-containing protein [Candidatus Saccharibacteria bacterium]